MNNLRFVSPTVYFVGSTSINLDEICKYLTDTDQREFIDDILEARKDGLSDGEILCSFYAKACYSALTTKKNPNISKVRSIADNIKGTLKSGHGSVFEHCYLNFMITNCSRVFTHELVRHRGGVAFSQTSGRYVRLDQLNIVVDPILVEANDLVEKARDFLEHWSRRMQNYLNLDEVTDFNLKKMLTSAIRRLLPNGQANEIGFSVNRRAVRHMIEMRTSRHAEWEIRYIFNQIYNLVKDKYPMIFFDARVECVDDMNEITFENKKI